MPDAAPDALLDRAFRTRASTSSRAVIGSAHHSRKVWSGGVGRSREAVQPARVAGSLIRGRPRRRNQRPIRAVRPARANRFGRRMTYAAAAIAIASASGRPRWAERAASTCRVRSSTSSEGMSILTGQASKQAPHSVEANGSESLGSSPPVMPVSWGARTAPIGPG